MSSYIDSKFINLLSTRLPKFKRKSEYLCNFRCPHCVDSQKWTTKARGFVYKKKNDMFFKCHNCGMGQSLGNLIKLLDPNLYKEYIFERFKDGKPTKDKPEFDFTPSKELKTKTISCKDVTFKIIGLSLASINIIISLILSVITLKLFLNYEKN